MFRSPHSPPRSPTAVTALRFVEDSDVAEAIRLMRVATQNAATDPRTGTIDMDMIATGQGASDRCHGGAVTLFCVRMFSTALFYDAHASAALFRSTPLAVLAVLSYHGGVFV